MNKSVAQRHRKHLSAAALGSVIALASMATAEAALHPGDKIDVLVFNHPELSTTAANPATLDATGNVTLPVAGTVPARGLDPKQLARAIQARLAPYVRDPAVSVQLELQSANIFVAGGPSGTIKYYPGETLTSALDSLQYPTVQQTASTSNITVRDRETQSVPNPALDLENGPIDYRRVSVLRGNKTLGPYNLVTMRDAGQPGPALEPDDTIQLVDKPVAVKVIGDVALPGVAHLLTTDPLSTALQQVGGVKATATQEALNLDRDGVTQTLSIGSPTFAAPAQNGDTVVVPRAPRVDVLGTVIKPGETFLPGNQTLIAAIYNAGGPDKFANLTAVQIVRHGVKTQYNMKRIQKGHMDENPVLQDGDYVFVPQGGTIDAQTIFGVIGAIGGLGYLVR